jgi:hypothetical protein
MLYPFFWANSVEIQFIWVVLSSNCKGERVKKARVVKEPKGNFDDTIKRKVDRYINGFPSYHWIHFWRNQRKYSLQFGPSCILPILLSDREFNNLFRDRSKTTKNRVHNRLQLPKVPTSRENYTNGTPPSAASRKMKRVVSQTWQFNREKSVSLRMQIYNPQSNGVFLSCSPFWL